VTEGENKNVEVTYTLNTDSQIKEPRNTGTYTVVYTILGNSYTGSGTAQLNINKATVEIKASDAEKIYGEKNPAYTFIGLIGEDAKNQEYIAKVRDMFNIASDADATGTKANAGEYPITVSLKDGKTLNDDRNYNLVIAQQPGKLTVKPKALTIQVDDAVRTYGEANVNPTYHYDGFVNKETEENLEKKPVFTYAENITENTDAGVYPNVITASGAESNNYTINYVYANQARAAALTVTKAALTASAGTARSSYLTVQFDKAVPGLTKEGFAITLDGGTVEITDVSADSTNKNYTLKGSFQNGKTYSIAITLGNNYDLTGSPVSATPKESGGGSPSGGGGGPSATTYTIIVTQGENGKISPETAKVNKNESKTFTIAANEGYEISDVLVDGKSVGAVSQYTFEKVTANSKITAEFKIKSTPTEWKNPFKDVATTDWFYNAVKFVNENKLMGGTTADTFNPDEETTRAMLVTVLYRMENEPTTDLSSFEDVKADDYFAKAVAWAKANNIVSGATNTQFAPNDKITREQVAAIMFRYAKYKGNGPVGAWAIRMDYTDLAEISDYASEAVMFCTMKNIMSGKGNNTFAPKDNATRAEIAAILQRYM
ncbi:MAG: S-layer homology domain-containing protein, partial [Christensenella sp.]